LSAFCDINVTADRATPTVYKATSGQHSPCTLVAVSAPERASMFSSIFSHCRAEGSVDFQRGALSAVFALHDQGKLMLDLHSDESSIEFADIKVRVQRAPLKVIYDLILQVFHEQIVEMIGVEMNSALRGPVPKEINSLLAMVPTQVPCSAVLSGIDPDVSLVCRGSLSSKHADVPLCRCGGYSMASSSVLHCRALTTRAALPPRLVRAASPSIAPEPTRNGSPAPAGAH
jgi:hypothetical protein